MGSIDTPEPRRQLPVLRLSKSRYTTGLQCHRRLWWTVHEPDAPEHTVGPELQAIFTQGHRVGEVAREQFPGGTLVDLEHWKIRERVEATDVAHGIVGQHGRAHFRHPHGTFRSGPRKRGVGILAEANRGFGHRTNIPAPTRARV